MIHALSIIGIICLAATVGPGTGPLVPVDDPTSLSLETAGQAGLKVVMDRATGRIVENPTSAELRALGSDESLSLSRRSAWDLRDFSLPGGGVGVALEKWAHHSLAVRRAENGDLQVRCIQGDVHEAEELPSQKLTGDQQ